MSDLNTPIFSYKQYVNDQQKLKQNGTVDADIQKQSPVSAGARGLKKTHEFTNTKVQMMGEIGDSPFHSNKSIPNTKESQK